MKYVIVLLTIATIMSCRKDAEKNSPPDPSETIAVRLQLQGDFSVSENPLPYGRHANGANSYAKTLRDSTLYAVVVYREGDWIPFSSGLFNQHDSIMLLLPKQGDARISAFAIRKGSGEGAHYMMQNGLQYFDYPLNTAVTNQMDSLHRTTSTMMWDTLSWLQVSDPANLLQALPPSAMPEVDAHYGAINISTSDLPRIINLQMRRVAFGVQLAADNFTTGKLLLEFPSPSSTPPALPQSVTPAGLSEVFIYSGDIFRRMDTYWGTGLEVSIKWVKAPGDTVAVGQKAVQFKRNVLTRLKVSLPGPGRISAPAGIIESISVLPQ